MRRIHALADMIAKATKPTTSEGDKPPTKRRCGSCGQSPRLPAREPATARQAEMAERQRAAALDAASREFQS